METQAPETRLLLCADARLERSEEKGLRIIDRGREFRVPAGEAVLAAALSRLADGGATEVALRAEVSQSTGSTALFSLVAMLRALEAGGALRWRVVVDGRPFATLTPTAPAFRFLDTVPLATRRRTLSRFTYLHADAGALAAASPRGLATLRLDDARAAAVVAVLAHPHSLCELELLFPDLAGVPLQSLLTLLENAALLDGGDGSAQPWEFHDLLFHMRSRRGRHSAPYGGTYRGQKDPQKGPLPLIKPPAAGVERIPLARPDPERLRRTEAPFHDVLERRRSVRGYAAEPITLEQLGEFLYRAARYQLVVPGEATDFALRPTPAGGALQELELYPVIASCRGLDPGVYHYRPAEHELVRIADPSLLCERLLAEARATANHPPSLNVYFQITARCGRVFWKYESMAYALILKNLGALYATMYLVATAMNLAPCALGGGDSDLFAAVAGLDPYEEPAVGEFLLGSAPKA
jgi:SagB-type dehydrogenase family enzyme